jgi:hypothetical protein
MKTHAALQAQTIGSLLVRLAWQRGEAPASLAERMGLGWGIWTRDLDRSLSDYAITTISMAIGLASDQVRLMTLTGALDEVGIPTRRNGFQRWVTPVGIYHRKRLRYGQLYCPGCLMVGPGHLQIEWRLATSWICGTHAMLLRDSCPQCDAPFAPFRNDALMLARCDRCGSVLTRRHGSAAPPTERILQMRVRSLWQDAFGGNIGSLADFHQALVAEAQVNPVFRGASEPWSYWRIAERRDLLVKVAAETLVQPKPLVSSVRKTEPRKVAKPCSRRRRSLPRDPANRAEALLGMAARVKFARRPKARIAKSA